MPGPFIFIATNRLRDGRFDAEQQRVPELVRFIEAHEPRLIAFNEYVNEDHSQVSVVQFHPDAASMEFHMGVVGDRARQAYAQTLEATTGIQVFGTPNMRTVLHCLPPRDWTEPGFMGLGMIYTAMPVTNAVPAVVAAEPGIKTLADLPVVTGRVRV